MPVSILFVDCIYCYMPPEFAINGIFSLNSNVFSFDKHKIYVCHIVVCTYIEFSLESPEVQGCLYPYLTNYSYSFINKYLLFCIQYVLLYGCFLI
jgi:hypothetical protein